MAWERRAGGGLYYVRKRRVNGRVVSEYVGTGLAAVLVAELDAEERAEREARREALRATQTEWENDDARVEEACQTTTIMTKLALVLAGYHQHHRGEWRKRRT